MAEVVCYNPTRYLVLKGSMAEEQQRGLEDSVHVIPVLRKALAEFQGKDKVYDSMGDTDSLQQVDLKNFSLMLDLAVVAKRSNANYENWHQKVLSVRQELKSKFKSAGDSISAIGVDEEYCRYLSELGKLDEAIEVALQMEDSFPNLKGLNKYVLSDIESRKPAVLANIYLLLNKNGQTQQAAELSKKAESFHFLRRLFGKILVTCSKSHDSDGLRALISQAEEKILFFETKEDSQEILRYLKSVVRNSKMILPALVTESEAPEGIVERADQIGNLLRRMEALIKAFGKFLKQGKHYQALVLAKKILEDLERYAIKEDDVLNLTDFAEQEPIRERDRVRLQLDLAEVAIKYNRLDIRDLCINGVDYDNKDALVNTIDKANYDDALKLWARALHMIAVTKDRAGLQEYFETACELYPDDEEYFRSVLVKCLVGFIFKSAMDVFQTISSLELQVDSYSHYIFERVAQGESFSYWKEYVDTLCEIEDRIVPPELGVEFSTEDVVAELFDDDRGEIFQRVSPTLLLKLGKLAAEKGEWDALSQIFQDSRLASNQKMQLIKDVSAWLFGGQELKY